MFRACELVLVNKIDLLPHLDFDLERCLYNIDQVQPDADAMLVSARTGEGIEAWREWLRGVAAPRGRRRLRDRRGLCRPGDRRPAAAERLEQLLARRTGPTQSSSRPKPSGSRGSAT